jgi:hypothetical protein
LIAGRALRAILGFQVVRHAIVLANHARVWHFLRGRPTGTDAATGDRIACAVVLPVLREEAGIGPAISHFRELLRPGLDRIVLVTTAREAGGMAAGTARVAAALADGATVVHVHAGDPASRKGDQVNVAAEALAGAVEPERWSLQLVVVYDIDSRPPAGSLAEFAHLAAQDPSTPLFHQSARFEVRGSARSRRSVALAEGAALRANRYVTAYELPRLLSRSKHAGVLRKAASEVTYGHVTGHGLGIRLDWLLERPLPRRTIMEDLAYSFDLAVRCVPVTPLRSLDRSGVPGSALEQHAQAERWFRGPARVLAYRRAASSAPRIRRELVTTSAVLICLEWLSCAVASPVLALALTRGAPATRRLAGAFVVLGTAQAVVAEALLGRPRRLRSRALAVAMFPIASAVFGLAGWTSLAKALLGIPVRAKTE